MLFVWISILVRRDSSISLFAQAHSNIIVNTSRNLSKGQSEWFSSILFIKAMNNGFEFSTLHLVKTKSPPPIA